MNSKINTIKELILNMGYTCNIYEVRTEEQCGIITYTQNNKLDNCKVLILGYKTEMELSNDNIEIDIIKRKNKLTKQKNIARNRINRLKNKQQYKLNKQNDKKNKQKYKQ
uniref:Uncharacterized protein n=1 Tax=Pithovirus LCPAC102 TaxID=2506587 RepID=A0A481Z634_9VIRU|nr:MAG: hypothetical protein LCPAC102_00200 [Pithovirus LCPAC102]